MHNNTHPLMLVVKQAYQLYKYTSCRVHIKPMVQVLPTKWMYIVTVYTTTVVMTAVAMHRKSISCPRISEGATL